MFLGERREMRDVGREVRGRWGARSDSSGACRTQTDVRASPWAWISRFALSAAWAHVGHASHYAGRTERFLPAGREREARTFERVRSAR